MKKTFAILLLSLLVIPFSGAYLLLKYQINEAGNSISEEIEQAVKVDQLTLLSFTQEESQSKLRWLKSDEFQFEGKMYDVVKTIDDGFVTHYWCFYHQRETELRNQLSDLVSGIMDPTSQPENETINFFSFLKDLYFQNMDFRLAVNPETMLKLIYINNNETSVVISPLSPPPKAIATK